MEGIILSNYENNTSIQSSSIINKDYVGRYSYSENDNFDVQNNFQH